MAVESSDLQALTRSLASFLYWSTFGRPGRGSACCGFGYMRISFHYAWSPPGQAERRFDLFRTMMGGHGPFRGLEAPLALSARLERPLVFRKPENSPGYGRLAGL